MKSRNIFFKQAYSSFLAFVLAIFIGGGNAYALTSSDSFNSLTFSSVPPTTVSPSSMTEPLVMLVMGNDHQLFYKAYNDWSDIDGDGVIDHEYKHSIDYYGYFDSYKCYVYDNSDTTDSFYFFKPVSITADKYCDSTTNKQWSGNFLNWATMSRIDIVRKVLYGGKRVKDTEDLTILERAFLPADAHSFAKFYTGADLNKLTPFGYTEGLTLCNTTFYPDKNTASQYITAPPLIRLAKGDFRYWNASEAYQCTWAEEYNRFTNSDDDNIPASAGKQDPYRYAVAGDHASDAAIYDTSIGPDLHARVQVCLKTASSDLIGEEKCKAYPAAANKTSYKPIGLLHTHGESGEVKFGLLTGTYSHNKSGGVVRKDISSFSDEVNNGDDAGGTEKTDGTFTNVDGIVSTLDKLRISQFEYGYPLSGGNYNKYDDCTWGLTSFLNGDCSNWGNPLSEMYLEAVRYLASLSRNTDFSHTTTDDNSFIPGLKNVGDWQDPFTIDNTCAACNIIILNTSELSYDSDELDMSSLPGSPDPAVLTRTIGENDTSLGQEDINGKDWFIGESGTDTNQMCTSKTISNFGEVKGICPNAARLSGTYNMSGIAHWAHTYDINASTAGVQKVNTYAVALSPSIPKIELSAPTSGKKVVILPACRNTTPNPDGNCSIVNFTIAVPHQPKAGDPGTYTGTFVVHWEDSEQGGDYDQDMKGYIKYEIDEDEIKVITKVNRQSASHVLGFGFIISGTDKDGFHVYSGINEFDYTDPTGVPGCDECEQDDPEKSYTFDLTGNAAGLLEDPLWYAAKWGGFNDINGNRMPDLLTEWDSLINDTGAWGSDGIPDNYFLAHNPSTLEKQLNNVFISITQRFSAGTSAAVVANTVGGAGAIYQAVYQPARTSTVNPEEKVEWAGLLHSFFIDKNSLFREDTNGNGQLDDTSTDYIIDFKYNSSLNKTQVIRSSSSDDGITRSVVSVVDIEEMNSLWNANDQLAAINETSIVTQRTYSTAVSNTSGRHILTWIDDNKNGVVDTGETRDFIASTFDSSNYYIFNLLRSLDNDSDKDVNDAKILVEYIRGKEFSNLRNRTLDGKRYLLGDIINSSPTVLTAPSKDYDYIYGDTTYRAYREKYTNRRQVVFVGANDGMLHAFNSGFYDPATKSYNLKYSTETEHPLGAELWAYVPMNLLPHLQWLTEPNYPHSYYVDGSPKLFDVNIFPDDTIHPGGWGTILVATMRLGGGANAVDSRDTTIEIDYDNDGTTDFTSRSAIMIFDVTDPESAPVLLAEYTDVNLGFTTVVPTIVPHRRPSSTGSWSSPSINDWYLVFGSGPTDLDTVTSTQNAYIYTIKLNDIDTSGTPLDVYKIDTNIAKSYIGQPHSVDWNYNFLFDAVYFGTVALKNMTRATTPETPATLKAPYETDGRLMRLILTKNASNVEVAKGPLSIPYDPDTDWTLSTVINPEQAFSAKPDTLIDLNGDRWIFAGTGRLQTLKDNETSTTESLYGIKETPDTGIGIATEVLFSRSTDDSPTSTELTNVTGVTVFSDGTMEDGNNILNASIKDGSDFLFTKLEGFIQGTAGWYRDLGTDTHVNGSTIYKRTSVNTTVYRSNVLFPNYLPPLAACTPEGNGFLTVVYSGTGTSFPGAGIDNTVLPTGTVELDTISTDTGTISAASVVKTCPSCDASIITLSGTGEMKQKSKKENFLNKGRQSWREIIGE